MVDIVAGAGGLEAVSSEGLPGCDRLPDQWRGRGNVAGHGAAGVVVREYRVYLVGHGLD